MLRLPPSDRKVTPEERQGIRLTVGRRGYSLYSCTTMENGEQDPPLLCRWLLFSLVADSNLTYNPSV
jgi:hypothetical protein